MVEWSIARTLNNIKSTVFNNYEVRWRTTKMSVTCNKFVNAILTPEVFVPSSNHFGAPSRSAHPRSDAMHAIYVSLWNFTSGPTTGAFSQIFPSGR